MIAKVLNGESLEEYAKQINIQNILKGGLAPKVAILNESGQSNSKDVELNLEVCQTDNYELLNKNIINIFFSLVFS